MDTAYSGFVGSTRRIRLSNLKDINNVNVTNANLNGGSVVWRIIDRDNVILDTGPGTYDPTLGWIASVTVPNTSPSVIIEWEVTRPPNEKEYFQEVLRVEHRHG